MCLCNSPSYRWTTFCFLMCSVTKSCPTLYKPMGCSMQGIPVLYQLPEFAQTHVHWLGDAIQPSHPLSPTSPPALNLLSIRVFSNESALCIRWPKYWSFSFGWKKHFICPLMDPYIASTFWQLWKKLLWTRVYNIYLGPCFVFFWVYTQKWSRCLTWESYI